MGCGRPIRAHRAPAADEQRTSAGRSGRGPLVGQLVYPSPVRLGHAESGGCPRGAANVMVTLLLRRYEHVSLIPVRAHVGGVGLGDAGGEQAEVVG